MTDDSVAVCVKLTQIFVSGYGDAHLFVQPTFQGDGEVALDEKPTMVWVLEVAPF